ncbi:MAG: hypothetical protein NTV49_14370 [Kiritimatiellaeota bacterium]|nr:hypothetical protein [Kiritimatiellota bacterium]
MERWDWIRVSNVAIHSQMPSAKIGGFLRRRVDPVDRNKTPFAEILPISIHFDGSISRRVLKEGREYSLPMLWVKAGDVVLSKIDLKNGAVGVLQEDFVSAAVTTHFAVYDPDRNKVLPEYFRLLVQTPRFKSWLADNKSGQDGRKEVKLSDFEGLAVPLPTLRDQRRLLAAYGKATEKALQLDAQAMQIERDAQREFEAALGLTPPPNLPKRFCQIARFRDIERWSHEGILQMELVGDVPPESKFDIVQLGDIATVSYGLQKCPGNRPGKHARPYLRVANVQRGRLDLREIKTINVPDEQMASYRLETDDVLFVEGNGSRKELGRVALWTGEIPDCVHQNHIIKARLDKKRACSEFIAEWFNTEVGRTHFFRNAKTTSGLGTINSNEVRTAPVPLPESTTTQAEIVQSLRKGRDAAAVKRKQAAALRAAAWNEFIAAVFT